ncbi:MAG: hypothetical protein JWR55_2258 [Aeromicrobium sp.]|nr:hypothetical protein [Aeromicrobium sp.]
MTALALLLLSLGTADLVRPRDRAARGAVLRSVVVGAAVAATACWGAGLPGWWAAVATVVVAAWVLTTPESTILGDAHPWPLVVLALLAAAALATGADQPRPDGWLTDWYDAVAIDALDGVSFTRFALGAGCLVFLVDSANIIVRMVLASTDAGVMASEQTLKGGRVLGPIERILIFALALSGEYAGLTAVVAAKGILRFPEISRDVAGRKAEYVLVGSFVSWALALVVVPLL